MSLTFVAFDLETTGLDSDRDAIIEIGCVRFSGDEVVDRFSSLINPRRKLSFFITSLTGITDRDLVGKPSIDDVLPDLRRFLGSSPLVAQSAGFDLGFLRAAGLYLKNEVYDTFELASILLPNRSSYSLGALAAEFGIELASAHRATDDAEATGRLFNALAVQASRLPLATLIEINRLAANSAWGLRGFFRDAEKEATSTRFLKSYERKALESGELGPLLNPQMQRRVQFPEELIPITNTEPLDVDGLAGFLEPGGPLAQVFPGYEHREPQIEMLRAVAEAFNNGDHVLIEAGTGTGKSLAYMLPAMAWALQNRRRVVVSTNTINLQDQLFTKDLPDIEQVFAALRNGDAAGLDGDTSLRTLAEQAAGFQVALMKGRSNYLCPRRLDAMRSRDDLSEDELKMLARVLVWLVQTTTGDRAELSLPTSRDRAIWARLATEVGGCSQDRCENTQGGRCFFYRNRREADGAHLIVVNHALLLSDVAVGNRALPEYLHLIVDEAHHLEDAITQQLSFTASQPDLERLLADIYPDGGEGERGILYDLRKRLARGGLSATVRQELDRHISETQQKVEVSRDRLGLFFMVLHGFVGDNHGGQNSQYGVRVRLDRKMRAQPAWEQVEIAWDKIGPTLYDLATAMGTLRKGLDELDESGVPDLEELLSDLGSLATEVMEAYQHLHAAIVQPEDNGIYWAELDRDGRRLSIHDAPLHVGPLVEQHLFHAKENVIMTSATLRTAGTYNYIQERLHAREAETVTVGSPFDYKESTLVFVPTDMGDPNGSAFQRQTEQAITALAKALGGRTLALFTSNYALKQTGEAIGPELLAAGITLYQQGSGGSRRQLLESFRSNRGSVLLGTRSFWEGVDVVGEALSGLVLTRLPFAVPSDPVVAARSETFDQPFFEYSVPDAILRFRQGFGRLIRSRGDRGICVILDNRVLTKRYGQLFLESLPECTVQRAPLSSLAGAARKWLPE